MSLNTKVYFYKQILFDSRYFGNNVNFVRIIIIIICRKAQREFSRHPTDDTESSPYDDTVLHRNHGLPVFTSDPICAFNVQRSRYFDTNTNDDQPDDNVIDASTYF